MKILAMKDAVKLYPFADEYCQKMGECKNCMHIRRTPKYIRPVRYYCFLHTYHLSAENNQKWNDEKYNWEIEDKEWEDDDIFFIKRTCIPCNQFEANTWWKKQVEKIFYLANKCSLGCNNYMARNDAFKLKWKESEEYCSSYETEFVFRDQSFRLRISMELNYTAVIALRINDGDECRRLH